jgi:hypothetical protein
MSEFNNRTLDELNEIADESRDRGAHAYFLFPSFLDRAYAINVEPIATLRKRLERGMRIPILGTAEDFVFPGKWFFDTRFHLNDIGRGPRTLKMVTMLRGVRSKDGW